MERANFIKARPIDTLIAIITIAFLSLFIVSQTVLASGKIVFTKRLDANWQIVVTDENGQNQINLSDNNANDSSPVWSPDGKHIAFISDRDKNQFRDYEIYIMDANGSNQRRITRNQLSDDLWPSFSPDGRRLAFIRMALQNPDSIYKVFVINVNGQDEKFLTDGYAPKWSPDGKKIAFSKNGHILIMDTDGNNQVNINNDGAEPAWSPDGKQIVFSSQRGKAGFANIYKMDSDGQSIVRLTQDDNGQHILPIWSPDGQYIAFTILPGINIPGGVEVIKADGSEPKMISENAGYPSWFDPAFAVNPSEKLASTWGGIRKK